MKPAREKVDRPLDSSIRCFRRVQSHFGFGWHLHPEYELTLISAGTGQRFVGDDMSAYAAGDLVLLGPNLPHTWVSDDQPAPPGGHAAVVVQFDQPFVDRMIAGCAEWRGIVRMLAQSAAGLHFDTRQAAPPAARMMELPDLPPGRRLPVFLEILWSLSQLDAGFVRPLAKDASSLSTGEYNRIDSMCDYIDKHLAEPISPDQMADKFHMSTSSFGRFFKKATHRGLIQYLNERRVGWACRLLQESDEPITVIAMDVGFTSSSYFNRVFVKCKGVGPREYRRKFQRPGGKA
ncbi:MAG: AraC family transcriptional regulator [Phycisphaerales bacterium]